MKRRLGLYAAVGVAVGVVLLAGSGGNVQAATCTLAPTLRDITVTQGLNTYNPLVRGKVALVRLYLSLPACAASGNAIAVKSALTGDATKTTSLTVTVKDAVTGAVQSTNTITTPTPAIAAPNPQITNLTALTDTSPSDPIFVVPGSFLTSLPTSDPTHRLTVTISASVAYQAVSPAAPENYVTFTTLPGTRTAITKTVERRTNALRVLVVPLGGALDAASTSNIQSMMAMFSRVFAVPGGVGPLDTTAVDGGIRYAVNGTALDLGALGVSFPPLCINNANFAIIKAQLAQFRTTWNAANDKDHQADKVLGAVSAAQSTSSSSNVNCFEGIASVSSPESFIRATTEPAGAMEVLHTFGLEPLSRSAGYHSYNTAADTAAGDLHRGYNTTRLQYISDTRSVMKYTPPGWTNDNVFLEPLDWSNLLCQLGGQTTTECTTTAPTAGTAVGVAAGPLAPAFNVTAIVDGSTVTPTESFVAPAFPTPPGATTSAYTIVQTNATHPLTGPLQTDRVTLSRDESLHGGPDDLNEFVPTSGLISASIKLHLDTNGDPNATTIQLLNGTSVLYTWAKTAAPDLTHPMVTLGSGINPGGSKDLSKAIPTTVAYPDNGDYYFLADTTGSMGSALDNVKTNINQIIAGIPTSTHPRFGAGDYKDFPSGCASFPCPYPYSPYAFTNNASIATDPPDFGGQPDPFGDKATAAAVSAWSPGGGGDGPEGQLYALDRIATPGNFFRSGSNKVIVWFGDNPGHDPICSTVWDGSYNITEGEVLPKLQGKGIKVMAVSVNSGSTEAPSPGLDGDPNAGATNYTDCVPGGTSRQGTRIANGTGGLFQAVTPTEVSAAIINALKVHYTFEASGTCNNEGVSISFSSSPITVTSGDTADFGETISVTSGTPPGHYSCTATFKRDGVLDTSLTQVIPVVVTGLTGPLALITWEDANAATDKYDVVLDCGSVKNVLAVALTTTFFDTNAACPGGGGTYKILANSGWGQSTTPAGQVPAGVTPTPTAVASIQSPTAGATFGQFDAVPLRGSATIDGSPVTDLHWSVDGTPVEGTSPNVAGLSVSGHTVTLSAGTATPVTASFTVLADADHDGLTATYEDVLHNCAALKGIPGDGGDNDPTNGSKDYDNDGILNRDEQHTPNGPCLAETSYPGQGIFLPNPFSVSSSTSISAGGIYVPGRDLSGIAKSTVKITEIAGIKLGTPIQASSWATSGGFGVAVFPKQPFVAFVTDSSHNLVGHTVSVRLEGGTIPPWSFFVVMSTKVVK